MSGGGSSAEEEEEEEGYNSQEDTSERPSRRTRSKRSEPLTALPDDVDDLVTAEGISQRKQAAPRSEAAPAAGKKRGRKPAAASAKPSPGAGSSKDAAGDGDGDGGDGDGDGDGGDDGGAGAAKGPGSRKRKASAKAAEKAADGGRRFQRELRSMMYGFGDDRQPLSASVHLMEDYVMDYVQTTLAQAHAACETRQRGAKKPTEARVKDRDLLFVLRKDPRRLARAVELLEVWKELKTAQGKTAEEYEHDDEEEKDA